MPPRVRRHADEAPQNKIQNYTCTVSHITLLLLFYPAFSSGQQANIADKGCKDLRCGNGPVNVSYPFSHDHQSDCKPFLEYFQLHCNATAGKLFMPYLITTIINNTDGNLILINSTLLEVTHITNDSLVIDVSRVKATLKPHSSIPTIKANSSSCGDVVPSQIFLPPYPGPFVISNDNQFGSSGCTYASYVTGQITSNTSSSSPPLPSDYYNFNYTTLESCSCVATCGSSSFDAVSCSNITLRSDSFRTAYYFVGDQNSIFATMTNCSATGGAFSTFFHPQYTPHFPEGPYLLKLKWALPSNQTKDHDLMSSPDYACSPQHSTFARVQDVPGYLCYCMPGFTGDGYLNGSGCSDVNECIDTPHVCVVGSKCRNLVGNYTCKCSGMFYVGDGRINGSGCHFSHSVKLGFVISSSILGFFVIIGSFIKLAQWWGQRKKRKYFLQNGGLQMQEYLRARPGREMVRLFKSEELKAATNNYAEDTKIGEGGFGVVFKGRLPDEGRLVAVKKAKIMQGSKDGLVNRQFLNEMAILTQVNHRHIVQLLGFCFETETPLLVYEYISNGNLAESLAAKRGASVFLDWEQRLKVAQQTAEALAYLHAAASPPILHRDVKSSNVLLDGSLDAKVSDFGLSRLVPNSAKQVSTAVQGTIGYLDPEYLQTLQLTDKSDVYSLGVILLELITSLKPVDSSNREPRFSNLALLFIHHMEEGKLEELVDAHLHNTETSDPHAALHILSSIRAVAALARQCLELEGAMRPSMGQVADELRHISRSLKASELNEEEDETSPLLMSSCRENGAAAEQVHGERGVTYMRIESNMSPHSGSSVDNIIFSSVSSGR